MNQVIKGINMKFPKVAQVTTNDLDVWLNENSEEQTNIPKPKGKMVLLDVRPSKEYDVSHLKNAVRADHSIQNVGEFVKSFGDQESQEPLTFICYCSIGYRSSLLGTKILDFLDSEEIPNISVYNLEGSIFKWANERRPLYKENNEKTEYAHPYSSVWGKLLDSELRKENK
ncbi:uncharacterized protein LOC106877608 [Argonauta hians]